nr:hypothetical protein [Tanacetum cinerariifolium]GEY84444.1 hypothetical protein [Tanacetum cinerariifolium]GEZ55191.1 hypothetical protein [Tanacetum cinerariifolium]
MEKVGVYRVWQENCAVHSVLNVGRGSTIFNFTHLAPEVELHHNTSAATRIRQVPSIHAISQEENLTDCKMVKNALSPQFLNSSAFRKHLDNKKQLTKVKGARFWRDLKNRVIIKPTQTNATHTKTEHREPDFACNEGPSVCKASSPDAEHHRFDSIFNEG